MLLAVALAWAATGGGYESLPALDAGYDPDPWYLGALALVGLACATAFGIGRLALSRSARVACGAFGGYVAWSFLSVLWAHDQGVAFLGSARVLVYFAAFLTFAILPWSNWSARAAAATLVAGVGVIAVVTAIRIAALSDPSGLYLGERLAYPLGYYNADAALFMTAAATAIALGSRRGGVAALRVAGLAIAALCLQLAVLSQSRGWLFSAPIVMVLMLVLIPNRLRLLLFAVGPVLATAATAPVLLRVYDAATPHGTALTQPRLSAVLHTQGTHAVRAMLIADSVLTAVALVAVLLDKRIRIAQATQRRVNRIGAAVTLAALLAGVSAGLVATHGNPVARAERAWHSFADSGSGGGGGGSHFTTLASNRADIWRVALEEFGKHPLTGVGQDNFAPNYIQLRRSDEEPRWAHSIELRLLVHTGAIGTLLFALFLLAAGMAALRRRGRPNRTRATAGILLVPLVVWLVHGSIDWFWEYPALSVPALAFLGAAVALEDRPRGRSAATPARSRRRSLVVVTRAAAALLAAGALTAIAIPFVTARRVQRAISVWPQQPALAYTQLRSATALMPFDAQIYLLGGAIALNRGEHGEAANWLLDAERRENRGWLAPFALGLLFGEEHRPAAARRQLQRAQRLNPREPVIALALTRVGGARPLTLPEAQRLLTRHIVTPRA